MDCGKIITDYRVQNDQSLRKLAEDLSCHAGGYTFNAMTLHRMEKNLCDMEKYYFYFRQIAENAEGDIKKLAGNILVEMDKK